MALDASRFRPSSSAFVAAIRVAIPDDAGTVSRIDAEAFETPIEQARSWIEPQLGAALITVALAVLDDTPVGIATAIRTNGRAGPCVGIFGVAVTEAARGRGIGSAITSWLIERAFAAGATQAHLNPDSEAAARLYSRLGFKETAGFDIYTDL
jgi:GNAT superfamily N-acetyltransferase